METTTTPRARPDGGSEDADEQRRCDFCRLLIPDSPVTAEHESITYEFCSKACRDALEEGEYVFSEYHGSRRINPGVSALNRGLPQGLPRNSFVLISAQAGTRDRAVHAEVVWRTLERGEPAVVVTFREPPGAVVQQFLTLEWNVLPYLERDQLHVIDCFTYRMGDRDRMFDRMTEWNTHLHGIVADATTTIRDPSDLGEVQNKLDNALEDRGMAERGVVLFDSLTELGTLVQPVQAYNFVKDIRADICKGRFVPVFAGATYRGDEDVFPHDLDYVADGIVDLRLNGDLVEDTLIKQARIRKMSDVLAIPEWHAYEYTAGLGLVMFDPLEEIEKSEARREAPASAGPEADADDEDSAAADDGAGTVAAAGAEERVEDADAAADAAAASDDGTSEAEGSASEED